MIYFFKIEQLMRCAMAKKKFSEMTPKERRPALGGSASALARRKKKNAELKNK